MLRITFACVFLMTALTAATGQARKTMRAVLFPNCQVQLQDGVILFTDLELDDGCVLSFTSNVQNADIIVQNLTLHGNSTINLSPSNCALPTFPKPPVQPQAHPETQPGPNGTSGTNGVPGLSGTGLKLTIQNLNAPDGALWIRTDGCPGGPGGPGGDGGKGSAGPWTRVHCADGGRGGDGGPGGRGGPGGSTAKVALVVLNHPFTANLTPGFAPSARPADANIPGAVVAAGAPGSGGPGGPGGGPGGGGEGHECHFPASDAHGGAGGHPGANGSIGIPGVFVP